MTDANALQDELERRLGLQRGDGTYTRFAVTGEPYTEVTSEGVVPDAQWTLPPAQWPTEQDAKDRWLETAAKYASGKGKTIYWRTLPQMGEVNGRYSVYARFLVSDKPPKQEAS